MIISAKGTIMFSPENKTKKHESQDSWKRVAMILTNDDLCEYYCWFIKQRFNLILNKPLRGSHVTFINDKDSEVPNFDKAAKLFNGKEIIFYIDPEPRTNGLHWWLRAYCKAAEEIRQVCGGTPVPYFDFHLTLGYANEKNLPHSNYILDISKKYELISSGNRLPFNEITEIHDIL